MTCEEVLREAAGAWGTGRLSPGAAEHLRVCPACREEVEATDEILGRIAREPIPDPGEIYWRDFGPRLRRRIAAAAEGEQRRQPVRSLWRPVFWALPAAAALLLVAASAWLAWTQWREGAAPAGGGAELARMEARIDAALEKTDAKDLDTMDALGGIPMTGALGDESENGANSEWSAWDTDPDAVAAAGDLSAAFVPEGFTEWNEMDRLVDLLSEDEAAKMIKDLDSDRAGRKRPDAGGIAG
jgi:hypothetical protein